MAKKDAVLRMSQENHARIKEMISAVEAETGVRPTLNQIASKMIEALDRVSSGNMLYLVGGKVFEDLAEARGEAIMQAVKNKTPPAWPEVLVRIGNDGGA
jgi:hypothetical protein